MTMRARLTLVFLPMIMAGFLIAAVRAESRNSATNEAGPVSVFQEVSSPQANYGDILTYTIALTNTSAITPVNLLVTDTLPSSLSTITTSLKFSQGSAQYASGVITWSDTLTPSAVASISFQARVVRASTTITNSFLADAGSLGVYDGPTVSTDVAPIHSFLPIVTANYCTRPLIDNFSDPASGWPIANTKYWTYGYLNGEYRFYAKAAAYGVVTRGEVGDPVVEVDAHQVSTVNGSYGIAYYIYQDWSQFWTFEIYPATQQYASWSNYNGNWYVSQHGTSSAIQPGQGTNHLKIVSIGPTFGATNTYDFYVNGTRLFREAFGWGDPSVLPTLRYGLTAAADAAGFDVRFDNYTFVSDGCSASPLTNIQRPSWLTDNLFEMQSTPSFAQRARPMVFTRVPAPVDKSPH